MANKPTLAQMIRDLWLGGYTILEISTSPQFKDLKPVDVTAAIDMFNRTHDQYVFAVACAGAWARNPLDSRKISPLQ